MSEGTQTVLIVDDDPQILRLVESMLRARPVKVLLAPTPSEALRLCQSELVDVLITDVSMPEMDGNRLAERVLKLSPRTQILMISGMASGPRVKSERVRFLKKPFFPAQLVDQLKEMLAASS